MEEDGRWFRLKTFCQFVNLIDWCWTGEIKLSLVSRNFFSVIVRMSFECNRLFIYLFIYSIIDVAPFGTDGFARPKFWLRNQKEKKKERRRKWVVRIQSFLAYFYPSGPFTCNFPKLSRFLLCWLWLTHGSCAGPQNKIGHPAGYGFPCLVPEEYK